MKKKANLNFVALIALLVVCCGAAVLSVASNSKYNAKSEYKRIEERYIAESGVDTAVGLFLNYLSNRDFVLAYTQNEGGGYSVIDALSPYLLDEIKNDEDTDLVSIDIVSNESKDYLASVGFLDFINDGTVELGVNTYGSKEKFKLTQMCVEPDFLLGNSAESVASADRKSKINPIFLTVTAKYRGGEVMANVKLSNLYVVRKPFTEVSVGEQGSVPASIDTDAVEIEFENYQNYRGIVK